MCNLSYNYEMNYKQTMHFFLLNKNMNMAIEATKNVDSNNGSGISPQLSGGVLSLALLVDDEFGDYTIIKTIGTITVYNQFVLLFGDNQLLLLLLLGFIIIIITITIVVWGL